MTTRYFTITGTQFRYGSDFIEPKMEVKLVKEPDNEYDKEAIKVEMPGLGQIGYVANSAKTVIGESYSAGRLYDKIGDEAAGVVMYVLPNGVLCSIEIDDAVAGVTPEKKAENASEETEETIFVPSLPEIDIVD